MHCVEALKREREHISIFNILVVYDIAVSQIFCTAQCTRTGAKYLRNDFGIEKHTHVFIRQEVICAKLLFLVTKTVTFLKNALTH